MSDKSNKETIIIVCPFNPFPPYFGGAARVFNLARFLSDYFYVIIVCNDLVQVDCCERDSQFYMHALEREGVKIKMVKAFSRYSQIFNPLLAFYLLLAIKTSKARVVLVEFPWLGFISLIVCRITGAILIIDEHNVEFQRFERIKKGNRISRFLLKLYEGFLLRSAAKVFCVSKPDRELIISTFKVPKERVLLVRNGVDSAVLRMNACDKLTSRKKIGLPIHDPVYLFHGKLDYAPNKQAVDIIKRELAPRVKKFHPSALFVIAGDNPPLDVCNDPTFIFTGIYPNIAELISGCDVVICPLKSGGGTRIKILEAIFCGRPVVSTGIGAEGLERDSFGDWLQITDDWDKFSELMVKLATRPNEFKYLIPYDLHEYDWRYIVRGVVNDILSYLEKGSITVP
ncbi:MAG: glycosyltransferase family 4 protein [Methanomassiliicoccales archaeon]|jgi:glycosyltransferase involved in cell wall biosynthesis|nr:glycosyltransferase family 4 protein [Methanomassiliicoccales archaeon]